MSLHSIAASRKTVKRPSWRCNLPFKPELGCNLSPAPCTTASNRECMQQYTTWKRPPHRSEINSWIVAVNGQNHKEEVEPASQKSENLRTVTKHTSIDPKKFQALMQDMSYVSLVFGFFVFCLCQIPCSAVVAWAITTSIQKSHAGVVASNFFRVNSKPVWDGLGKKDFLYSHFSNISRAPWHLVACCFQLAPIASHLLSQLDPHTSNP